MTAQTSNVSGYGALTKLLDNFFVVLQRALPARTIGRLIHRLARSERAWVARPLIAGFRALYGIGLDDAARGQSGDYASLNDFFTRALKPGARPVHAEPESIVSPADGYVQRHGALTDGALLQAKGLRYSAAALVGAAPSDMAAYERGQFLTVYLAPHNYHRVHMPIAATVEFAHFLPGRLLSVNRATTRTVPGLFIENERLACRCRGAIGPFWLIFVGAMNVASISTAWAGEVNAGQQTLTAVNRDFAKGEYVGHFNLGSTVILLFPGEGAQWDTSLSPDRALRVGQPVGRLREPR